MRLALLFLLFIVGLSPERITYGLPRPFHKTLAHKFRATVTPVRPGFRATAFNYRCYARISLYLTCTLISVSVASEGNKKAGSPSNTQAHGSRWLRLPQDLGKYYVIYDRSNMKIQGGYYTFDILIMVYILFSVCGKSTNIKEQSARKGNYPLKFLNDIKSGKI